MKKKASKKRTSCSVPKTKKVKNANGTNSIFKKSGSGMTKAQATAKRKKKSAAGSRATVVKSCGKYYLFVGPKKKTAKRKKRA